MSQTERIFYIIDALLDDGYFRRSEVAEHFEVSEKQIWRDKEYLVARCPLTCGNLDLLYDHKIRGYKLTEESYLRLTKWRADSSLSIAKEIEAGNKRMTSSSSLVRSDADYIKYKSYAKEHFSPSVYNTILKALKEKKRIKIKYKSLKGESERVLDPLKLINYTEIWYLVAARDEDILTFSLSRIEDAYLLKEDVTFQDEDKLEKVLSSYGIYSDDIPTRLYKIRFKDWAAQIVSAQVWQKDQKMKILEGGKVVELTLPITNHTELLSRILFYGDAAEPIEPEDFVREYRAKCKAMSERYEEI